MTQIKVKTPIRYKGEKHMPGDMVEMDEKSAREMIAIGAATYSDYEVLNNAAETLELNANTASLEDLLAVKGIGEKTAAAIISGRPWDSMEALEKVKGLSVQELANNGVTLYI